MRKQMKIAALTSAAALLAIGASMTSFAVWQPVGDGTSIWVDSYGDPESGWHRYQGDGEYYCTDDDGRVITNSLISADGYVDDLTADTVYYVGADGRRQKEYWVSVPNDEEVVTGSANGTEYVPSTLYLYATSKRSLAKGSAVPSAVSAYRSGAKADKGIFVFDSDGYMMGGEVVANDSDGNSGTYYCVTIDDLADNLIELEEGTLAEKYVEGQALEGWAKFYKDELTDDESYEWRYYKNGKMVTGKQSLSWQGKTSTYYFDSTGALDTETAPAQAATVSTATSPNGVSVNFTTKNNDGVIVTQTGWYSEVVDDETNWYYIVNVIDSDHKLVRGVVFNAGGDGKNRAKLIDGKYYVFGPDGIMLDGIQTIDYDTTYTDKDWYGIKCAKLDDGEFYFNNKPNSGHRGEMETGRVTYTDNDVEITSYVDPKQGVMKNAIVKDYYYDKNGYLYTSLDDTYEIVPLASISSSSAPLKSYKVVSGKTLDDGTAVTSTATGTKYIIVDRNGKVLKSGNKKIGDITYTITDYVAVEKQ